MTSKFRPHWIQLSTENMVLEKTIGKPKFEITMEEVLVEDILDVCQQFLSHSTPSRFSASTQKIDGTILLQRRSKSSYKGIWIPNNFPSLLKLIKTIIDDWFVDEDVTLVSWIDQFFSIRLNVNYLELFQISDTNTVILPPIFLLNKRKIDNDLLPELRDRANQLDIFNKEHIANLLDSNLPYQLNLRNVNSCSCQLDATIGLLTGAQPVVHIALLASSQPTYRFRMVLAAFRSAFSSSPHLPHANQLPFLFELLVYPQEEHFCEV